MKNIVSLLRESLSEVNVARSVRQVSITVDRLIEGTPVIRHITPIESVDLIHRGPVDLKAMKGTRGKDWVSAIASQSSREAPIKAGSTATRVGKGH